MTDLVGNSRRCRGSPTERPRDACGL